MKKSTRAAMVALKAAIPKVPDFLVAKWFEGEEKPKPPTGFEGTFVIIKVFSTRAELADPDGARKIAAQAKLGSGRNMETLQ